MPRRRVDTLLAERGLAPSRSAAATSVRAGLVRIGSGGERASKPGQLVAEDTDLRLDEERRYVSRGGLKLEAALEALEIDPAGLDCLDVGASTGGFTDCLLKRGAARVVALDVGRGQLDWLLRNDERVTALEGLNVRELLPGDLPFLPDLITVDVSFISARKILPALSAVLGDGGRILLMVKPQFELGPGRVRKGGVVRSREDRTEAVRAVADAAGSEGLGAVGASAAGVPGPKGNREVFLLLARGGEAEDLDRRIDQVIV